jgi:hypothetical protein
VPGGRIYRVPAVGDTVNFAAFRAVFRARPGFPTSSVPDAVQGAGGAAWGVVAWVLATFAHYVIAAC